MRNLIIVALYFFAISANAGEAKLTWCHENRATDGSIVQLTGFKFYWRVNNGPESVITYGPPMPLPWKVENGCYYYSKTFFNDAWVPGANVCFQATALSNALESDRSGQVCKLMPADPTAPVIIEIDPK